MIEINNLTFSYTGKKPYLLNDVSLNIEKGMYVSIVGENGSCKSTLLKLILGLLHPVSGNININTKNIGYVPQKLESFNSQFPISVEEVLLNHCKVNGIKDLSKLKKALKKVDLYDFKHKLIGNLSGGQQQRVFIARALIGDPELLILDEPSTGVDSKNQKSIYSLLKELNTNGKTIISVEHNIDIALCYSTHIIEVIEGSPKLYTKEEFIKYKTFNRDNIIGM